MRADSHVDMSKSGRKDQRGLWGRDRVHQRAVGASEEEAYGENLNWERLADPMRNGTVVGNSPFN